MTEATDPARLAEGLRAAIGARFVVEESGDDWLGLVVPVAGGERRARILAARALGREWLVLLCRVAGEDELAHRDALECNARLAVGALALSAGAYDLKLTLAAGGLDAAQLDAALRDLAAEATRLRDWVRGRAAATHVFSFLSE